MYPNVVVAAKAITAAAGPRGLFTGYLPTLLEDIPDMAFKFAAYESLRAARLRLMRGRKATVQVCQWGPSDPSGSVHACASPTLSALSIASIWNHNGTLLSWDDSYFWWR